MPVLRLTSKKTYPLLLLALRRVSFTQTELAQEAGVSVGRVNKVITTLKKKGIIVKKDARYHIVQPNKLTQIIAEEEPITLMRTFQVGGDALKIAKELQKQEGIVCGQSAFDYITGNESPSTRLQVLAAEEVFSQLNTLPRGEVVIEVFESSVIDIVDKRKKHTSDVQTVVDLRCLGQGVLADELGLRVWGTRQ